jgi:hypothetical protein
MMLSAPPASSSTLFRSTHPSSGLLEAARGGAGGSTGRREASLPRTRPMQGEVFVGRAPSVFTVEGACSIMVPARGLTVGEAFSNRGGGQGCAVR